MDTRNTKKNKVIYNCIIYLFSFEIKNIVDLVFFYLSFRIPPLWAKEVAVPDEGLYTSQAGTL